MIQFSLLQCFLTYCADAAGSEPFAVGTGAARLAETWLSTTKGSSCKSKGLHRLVCEGLSMQLKQRISNTEARFSCHYAVHILQVFHRSIKGRAQHLTNKYLLRSACVIPVVQKMMSPDSKYMKGLDDAKTARATVQTRQALQLKW